VGVRWELGGSKYWVEVELEIEIESETEHCD
jgi:hypothetical protein